MSGEISFESQNVAQAIDRNDVKGAASLLSQIYQTDSRQFSAIVGNEQAREQQNPGLTRLAIQDAGNGTSTVFVTDGRQAQPAGLVANRPADSRVVAQPGASPTGSAIDSFLAGQAARQAVIGAGAGDVAAAQLAARPAVLTPDVPVIAQPPMRQAVIAPETVALQPAQQFPIAQPLPIAQPGLIPGYQPAVFNPQQHLAMEASRLAQAVNMNNFGATVGILQHDFRTNPQEAIRLVQNEVNREAMTPGLRMPGRTHVEMRGGTALVADGYHRPIPVGNVATSAYGYGNPYPGVYPYRPAPIVPPVAVALGVPLGGFRHRI